MKLVRILPLYAMSVLLAGGLSLLASARHWSGGESLLAGAVVAFIFLATVVVPWLLREYGHPRQMRRQTTLWITSIDVKTRNGGAAPAITVRENYSGSSNRVKPPKLVHY
jgi:hypothetical protein